MKKLVLSVILIFMFININTYNVLAINQNNVSNQINILNEQKLKSEITKLNLEADKLKAETEKIKKENDLVNVPPIIQSITVLLAIMGAIVTLWGSIKTNRNSTKALQAQTDKDEKEYISKLLIDLANLSLRIPSIQGLSRYENAIPYLINVLHSEDGQEVEDAIYLALSEMPDKSLKKLISENRVLYSRQKRYAIKLLAHKVNINEIGSKLDLDEDYIKNILTEEKESIERISSQETDINQDKINEIFNEWQNYSKYLLKIVKAIEYVINATYSEDTKLNLAFTNLSGIELYSKDLSEWIFNGSYLFRAVFNRTNCSKTNFQDAFAKSSRFENANLYYSKFDNAFIDNSYFAKSDLEGASFTGCQCNKVSFGGTHLKNTRFDRIHMEEGKFSGSYGENISFDTARIFRSEFMNVEYKNANFINSKLNYSRFDKSLIDQSNFTNVEMDKILLNGGEISNQVDKKLL